jgi:SAM-dependent methyltransferase
MGIGIDEIGYFASKGLLGSRVLDVGAQNLHNATIEAITKLATRPLPAERAAALASAAQPYAAELFALLGIEYLSYDICLGPQTHVFDLNRDRVPDQHRGYFDLVLNCGTTEHVLNQLNCFRVMHEALRAGGVAYHQVPASGYFGHGYVCYPEQLFRDFARANNYDILNLWYVYRGDMCLDPNMIDVRNPYRPLEPHSGSAADLPFAPSYNLAVLLKKRTNAPMMLPLELRTGTAAVDETFAGQYIFPDMPARALLAELSRRAISKLGRLFRF